MAKARKPKLKDVHLMVDPETHKLAKIECAKQEIGLSRATELLWKAWAEGKVIIKG